MIFMKREKKLGCKSFAFMHKKELLAGKTPITELPFNIYSYQTQESNKFRYCYTTTAGGNNHLFGYPQ
jgi:hypothetical protein